jgi:hypothetical protein
MLMRSERHKSRRITTGSDMQGYYLLDPEHAAMARESQREREKEALADKEWEDKRRGVRRSW